jgi:hypothetical protein
VIMSTSWNFIFSVTVLPAKRAVSADGSSRPEARVHIRTILENDLRSLPHGSTFTPLQNAIRPAMFFAAGFGSA